MFIRLRTSWGKNLLYIREGREARSVAGVHYEALVALVYDRPFCVDSSNALNGWFQKYPTYPLPIG